jgi:membrane protein
MFLNEMPSLFYETAKRWNSDKVSVFAAALSYYAIFTIAPLSIFIVIITGMVFRRTDAWDWLIVNTTPTVGPEVMQALRTLIENIHYPSTTIIATGLGLVTFFLGATGIVVHLKHTFDLIWKVNPKPGGFRKSIMNRLFSFMIVITIGLSLLVLAVISAALTAAGTYLDGLAPSLGIILNVLDFVITIVLGTLLFAVIFKYIPDVFIPWSDVWAGSLVTALLFFIGKLILGLYFGKIAVHSVPGTAGSLVVIILWIYYSAQILFFGAEFIQVYVKRHGSGMRRENAWLPGD